MEEVKPYFNLKEAAAYIGINEKLMKKITYQEGFPCVRSERRVIIQRKALDEWFSNNSNKFIR